jgi:hypothetical protein
MNLLIAKSWVEMNLQEIIQEGAQSLLYTPASPIDFEFVAHQVAMEVGKGTSDYDFFERAFWDCYRAKLNNSTSLGDLYLAEKYGELTAFVREV